MATKKLIQPFSQWVTEDAPANAAGNGGVAGIGVGPDGEPGFQLKRKRELEKWSSASGISEASMDTLRAAADNARLKVAEDDEVEQEIPVEDEPVEPEETPLQRHHLGVIKGLMRELGRTRYQLTQNPNSRNLKKNEASLQRKITRENNKIAKSLEETVSQEAMIARVAKCLGLDENELKRDFVFRLYESEGMLPKETFAGADVFEVKTDSFLASRFGKNRYHRYSRYVGEDETGEAIRVHGRTTKRDIILKDGTTGAMVYLRRKGQPNLT